MKPATYEQAAEIELVEAARYYEGQQAGLGHRFLDAVDRALLLIQEAPERWSYLAPPVRSIKVGRFPYRLLYVDEMERVAIVAVMHLHRKPDYWKKRNGF